MTKEELLEMLEKSTDKYSILTSHEVFQQCSLFKEDFLQIMCQYLTNEQKVELFQNEFFANRVASINHPQDHNITFKEYMDAQKEGTQLLMSISDERMRMDVLTNPSSSKLIPGGLYGEIFDALSNEDKISIFHNVELMKERRLSPIDILNRLSPERRKPILLETEYLVNEYKVSLYALEPFLKEIHDEAFFTKLIEEYHPDKNQLMSILPFYTSKGKKRLLLEDPYHLSAYNKKKLLKTLEVDDFLNLVNENQEWIEAEKIKVFELVRDFDKDKVLEIIAKLPEIKINEIHKRLLVASIPEEIKKEIDKERIPSQYQNDFDLTVNYDGYATGIPTTTIAVNLEGDLERYRGLDEYIFLNAETMSTEDRNKMRELHKVCPNMMLISNVGMGQATLEEFDRAEEWIDSVIHAIPPEWSPLQKLAYIDVAIGKRVSYSPLADTEMMNEEDARSLWKIVNSGYGVCRGISELEVYMLGKVGIHAETVSGMGSHSFVKVLDMEMPNEQGEMVKTDTIVDPTWNLTSNRYGLKPQLFCINYQTARSKDLASDGTDCRAHLNDENLSNITFGLSSENMRNLYQSIGVITREDGKFPAYEVTVKAREIDSLALSSSEKMKKLLELIPAYCPDFASCHNSTISFAKYQILAQPNLAFDTCVLGKVHEKGDKDKKPNIYVYSKFPDGSDVVFLADGKTNSFVSMPLEEFEQLFECYEETLAKNNGISPWRKNSKAKEDLAKSSGGHLMEHNGTKDEKEER